MHERITYRLAELAEITQGLLEGEHLVSIRYLQTDSRRVIFPEQTLFFALESSANDGHKYIPELCERGVKVFVVKQNFVLPEVCKNVAFIRVDDVLTALQDMAAAHRSKFDIPVVGITGSNGKTTVKEWLFQLLQPRLNVVRNPRSYNSQTGVALSLWNMSAVHETGVFEAGISLPGEMHRLQRMIKPTIGIFTNIGHAHDQGFADRQQKIVEKARLFKDCKKIIYRSDYRDVDEVLRQQFADDRLIRWSFSPGCAGVYAERTESGLQLHGDEELTLQTGWKQEADLENLVNAVLCARHLGIPMTDINREIPNLHHVDMRLEERQGIRGNLLLCDFYNSDPESVRLALEHLMLMPSSLKKIVVISAYEDLPESRRKTAYEWLVNELNRLKIHEVLGVGDELTAHFSGLQTNHRVFSDTQQLMTALKALRPENSAILLKGARRYGFEVVAESLQEQIHQTWLEVNLSAMAHNLRHYRSKLKPGAKLMAMVKALSYGTGSIEIARLLQQHRIDYLGVAYVDEAITLRNQGISMPVMVMNADPQAYSRMITYALEPELYSLKSIREFLQVLGQEYTGAEPYPIHLKLETGMNRLGIGEQDLEDAMNLIRAFRNVRIASVFSHLAASENPVHDEFTRTQINRFTALSERIAAAIGYMPLRHLANTGGVERFQEAHFDMVRLGIGLYGVAAVPHEQEQLQTVSRWMTRISQIKKVEPGESVGYGRSFIAEKPMFIATLPVGYADGIFRSLGNGRGHVFIGGERRPFIGKICMDMLMCDVTGLAVQEGDMAELLGEQITVTGMAKAADTIPYEILTHISTRVPRVYITE